MNSEQARTHLVMLIDKYVEDKGERKALMAIAMDQSLPRVPVKGVLARLDQLGVQFRSAEDQKVISDLVYFYI